MLGTAPCELTIPELSLLTDMIPALALQYGEKAEAKLDSARTQDELNAARADLEVMRRLLDINQKFLDSLSGNPYGNLPVRRQVLASELGLFTQSDYDSVGPTG